MTIKTQTQTRQIVRDYFDAWTHGDVSASGRYFADDLTVSGTLKHINGAADYLIALSDFRKLVTTGNDLISELYGDAEATLIYDSHTVAGVIRIAEHIRLTDGKISSIILILDPTALRASRASADQCPRHPIGGT
jgi:hypothetical protein